MGFPVNGAIETIHLPGQVRYADAYAAMTERRAAVEAGQAANALFLLEHAPVITLGRNAHASNLLLSEEEYAARGIEVHIADRGGDVTYHGPGQLVAYPVLQLNEWRLSIRGYLRALEEVMIRLLAAYELPGERVDRLTGVWVRGAKVAAIGVGLRHGVTYHGVALNVAPDMEHFSLIVPCGIANKPVTSLAQLVPSPPSLDEIACQFDRSFRAVFAAT
mgnify:CR=1 FL=1